MGRIQSFDSPTVVRAARDLFWGQGFEATSITDLEEATGVGRSSLYHCFGNKQGLFDAAIDDYLDAVIRPRLRILQGEPPAAGALVDYFDGLRLAIESLPDGSSRRGCLLVSCAAGPAGAHDATREVVDGYWAELTGALRHALTGAQTPDVVGPALVDSRARTLAALSTSAMVLARVNRAEAVAMLVTATGLIRSWGPARLIAGSGR